MIATRENRVSGLRLSSRMLLLCIIEALCAVAAEPHPATRFAHLTKTAGVRGDDGQRGSARVTDLTFTHLTTNDGLSQNSVTEILQDRRGFMWFATRDGLNRYDGNSFVVYKHNPNDHGSLSANYIWDLMEDDHGYLWIATDFGGVNRFDPTTERFVRYRHDSNNPNSICGDAVESIAHDSRGHLWFGTTDNGLDKFDPSTGAFTHYVNDSDGQFVGRITKVIAGKQGDIWFVGTRGLFRLNPQTGQITRLPATANINLSADYVYEDDAGNLWMLAWEPIVGLVKYDRYSERLTKYPVETGAVGVASSNFLPDGQNGFWVPSSQGLYYFDRKRERFTCQFRHDEANPSSLDDSTVVAIYQDRGGLLWAGTGSGINLLNLRQEQFGLYRHLPTSANSLSSGKVTAIYEEPNGMLWVGFLPRALDRFDRKTGELTHYVPDPKSKNALSKGMNVAGIYKDPRRGDLWLGGWGSGLDRFDERTGQFKNYRPKPADPNSLISDGVYKIYGDRRGHIWVGQLYGVSRFDPETEQFANYRLDSQNPTWNGSSVWGIYEDRFGTLWLGTTGGALIRVDEKTGTLLKYTPDPRDPHKLNGGPITGIREDRTGTLWVAAWDGLYRCNRQDGTFTRYTENQGLPSSVIQGILEDKAGRLWLSTKKGISRFDPGTKTCRNYDVSDGLQSDEFSESCYFQGPDGEMFFGGSNGFNAFFPENIQDNPYVPPVVVTSFKIFNKPVPIGSNSVLTKAIPYVDGLTLSYRDHVFSFEFAALSYANSQKNRYRYKLEGFDPGWNEVGSKQRLATYTNLDPGKYVFRVQGSNCDGVWNEQGVSLPILIAPPWWKTNWFRTLSAGIFLVLLWCAYQFRIGQLQRESKRLRDVIETIPAMAWTALPDGSNEFVNRRWAEYTGLTAEDTAGSGWTAAVHPDDRQPYGEKWRATLATGEPFEFEARFRCAESGEYRWFLGRGAALRDKHGDIRRWYGVLTDIEDRKRAEEAIRESETRFRTFVDHVADAILVQDEQGTIVDVNRQGCERLGYTRQEVIGTTPATSFCLNAEEAAKEMECVAQQTAAGETAFDRHWHRRKDGTVFPVEVHTRLFWYRGRQFLLKVARDISDRLRAEKERAYLASIVESSDDAIIGRSTEGIIQSWNRGAERLYGYTANEAIGQPIAMLIPPDRAQELVSSECLERGERIEELDTVRVGKGGRCIEVSVITSPMNDAAGRVFGAATIARDISARKRAEEVVRQLEADLAHINRVSMMGELAASIAHEVNQPLSGIVSNGGACLRWLAGDPPNIEEVREAVGDIVRDGKRAGEVIARIRALTRRTAPPKEKLDLNETIQEVLAIVGDEAKRNRVMIRTRFTDDAFAVLGDRVQLQQVVLNLVMNAIEAMSSISERPRELVITTRNIDPDQVQVTVEDSGTGLDPNAMTRIFEPFYTTKAGGMGMGLSISRSILQNHGGRLWATANDGPGTTFHFTLPKRHGEEQNAGAVGV